MMTIVMIMTTMLRKLLMSMTMTKLMTTRITMTTITSIIKQR